MTPRKKKAAKAVDPVEVAPEVQTEPAVPEPEDKAESRRARLIQKPPEERAQRFSSEIPAIDSRYQKLFEAPDGTIMVGEKSANKMWYPRGGIFILPRRGK